MDPHEYKHVWVVETCSLTDEPLVEQYELIEILEHSVKVNKRSHYCIIREATGRSFFYHYDQMSDFIKVHMRTRLKSHERRAKEISTRFSDGRYPDALIQIIPASAYPKKEAPTGPRTPI